MKFRTLALLAATLSFCLGFSAGAYALQPDSVFSNNITEADGTTGQDTNSGSGVKTGHIQNGAVTNGKIADGAVTDTKISGTISGTKLGAHMHNGSDINDGTISTNKLQDGAITDTKISGPISASKISSLGLNADTVDGLHATDLAPAVHTHAQSQIVGLEATLAEKSDVIHNHDARYQQKYGKVAVVAQTGGDYASPLTAMNDMMTWCGTPSETNPCLMKIMPGIYDLGSASLQTVSYVDVEGSGENTTIITGQPTATGGYGFLINGAGYSEIRSLTINNTGGAQSVVGIYDLNLKKISHVMVKSSGGGAHNLGLYIQGSARISDVDIAVGNDADSIGIFNIGSTTCNNVTINSQNQGLVNQDGGNATLSNVTITAGLGIYNQRASLYMTNSIVQGGWRGLAVYDGSSVTINRSTINMPNGEGIANYYSNSTVGIGASQVIGSLPNYGGLFRCYNVYDENFAQVVCP